MPLPKDQAWFPAKTYGWGWGVPTRWPGWVVMLAYIAAVTACTPLAQKRPFVFVSCTFALTGVMIVFGYWKGEEPRWRWGKDPASESDLNKR